MKEYMKPSPVIRFTSEQKREYELQNRPICSSCQTRRTPCNSNKQFLAEVQKTQKCEFYEAEA